MNPPEDQQGDGSKNPEEEQEVIRLPRRRESSEPDVEILGAARGSRPGARYYRVPLGQQRKLRQRAPGQFEAMPALLTPRTAAGRFSRAIRTFLVGRPLATAQLPHERLSKLKALAIFSSDNLSSSAYATEEILLILILAGSSALKYSIPISIAITALIVIVVTSYRQLIRAYPNGGGAYVVAKENFGVRTSLVAGSALFVDYILTVAVSTAAGVAAVVSALPEVHDLRIEIAVGFVILLTIGNLRGIRESGTIFAVPTYFFILMFGAMIGVGITRLLLGADLVAPAPPQAIEAGTHGVTALLLLRAFASGSAALTGIEAVANGVPSFKPPEARNAVTTQAWMAVILAAFFIGTTILAREIHATPSESKTIIAQLAQEVFGKNVLFYMLQAATALILVLAANTSFAGLPMLASVMARDAVMPKQFAFRGDRLAFSNGILVLGLASSVLLVWFGADTHRLIPLYAFGVFMAFTISQSGMVIHWLRTREKGWRLALGINGTGAVVTAVVATIIGVTKFASGAWISMAALVLLALGLWAVKKHYDHTRQKLTPTETPEQHHGSERSFLAAADNQLAIVPVDEINEAVLRSIAYARAIAPTVVALHVADNPDEADTLRDEFKRWEPDVRLHWVESPYRSLIEPVLAYLDLVDHNQPGQMVTVVLPEFITRWPWQAVLHNQLARRLRKALVDRPRTVVVEVPYHLDQPDGQKLR